MAEQVALAGVLDQRSFDDPAHRAWVFRTIGRGHDRDFWAAFVRALARSAMTTSCPSRTRTSRSPVEGVEEAAAFMLPMLGHGVSSGRLPVT